MNDLSIEEINNYLREGKTVKEIRELLGYSEKAYQSNIKMLGYKYNQREKQYVLANIENMPIKASNTLSNTSCNTTNLITKEQSINFIYENIQDLQEMLMYYKRNKECNTNNNGIVIDLIDDKLIDNGNPISVRINRHIWKEWQEFTKGLNYNSKELISMALKEYIDKYKK